MNAQLLLPTLLSLSLAFACKSKQNASGQDKGTGTAKDQSAGNKLGGSTPADSLFLNFERTPCFGMCPAYRIHLYTSGRASFEGRSHVEKEGMHEARVGRDTMEMILKQAELIGFFELEDVYDSPVTDLPSTIIRIQAGGRNKEVLGRVGVPPNFRAFAEYLDELLLPVPWTPVAGQH
jgi:hypothetical protein